MAELDPRTQLPMFELATRGIENFVTDLGRFTPFALATRADGEIQILETSGEFEDATSARQGLIEHLVLMKAQKQIIGCLVCAPVEVPSAGIQAGAVMEIEADGHPSVCTLRQILNGPEGPRLAEEVVVMCGLALVF